MTPWRASPVRHVLPAKIAPRFQGRRRCDGDLGAGVDGTPTVMARIAASRSTRRGAMVSSQMVRRRVECT